MDDSRLASNGILHSHSRELGVLCQKPGSTFISLLFLLLLHTHSSLLSRPCVEGAKVQPLPSRGMLEIQVVGRGNAELILKAAFEII